MTEWKECKLKELADFNPDSLTAKSKLQFINYLDTGNITKGKIDTIQYLNLSTDKVPSRAKRIVKKNDIVYSTVRPNQEHYGIIKNPVDNMIVSTGFVVLRSKEDKCYSDFLYYFLTLPENTEYLSNVAEDSTTAYPSITPDVIMDMDISLPPLPEQKAIAEVLSSLDDKIDLLTRQNKTLEDIAQAYFRKWFIEDASDEWEIKKLRDFGEIICGKTPPTTNKKFFNGNIPFIKIPDMHNNVYIFDTADTLSEMGAKYQENKFIPPMSICVSCIATVGLVSMNVFLSQTNQQINSLIPKHDKYRYYLFLFLRSYRDELLALGSGGTMTLNINKTLFGDIECYCPDDEILFRFNNVVNPLFGKIYNNCKQIRILSKLRNTLLPKLISGEIRVKM